jgi:hypothetical protein
LGDESRLVIASEQGDPVSIAYFEGEQHEEGLDAVPASVDVVAHENIVGVGRVASDFEEFKQVVQLSVDVPAYGDGRSYFDQVGLTLQDIFGRFTETLDAGFLNLLTTLQLLNNLVCQFFCRHSHNLKFY